MADKNNLKPGNKEYDGKVSGEPFSVVSRCQSFAADVFIATSGATKEYRFTICKVVQTYSCELIHLSRQANEAPLGSSIRTEYQDAAIEYVKKIDDVLPVVRRCRCFSINKEKELHKKLGNLKVSFNYWIASDKKRLEDKGGNPD